MAIASITRDGEATVVGITHEQAEAFALADDIAVLDKGELAQIGPPEQIYRQPATLFVARFTGSAGELPGHVLGVEGGYAIVDLEGHPLPVRYAGSVGIGMATGKRGAYWARPGRMRRLSGAFQ